ncbi:MAG: ChrR family anti-sigma-E factor [Rhodospirillales bacterium]|nr:ChrR family anti-sigma-E factor [Rhodospirillales bacterium]
MSSHHPDKDLLLSYSAGSLGEGWSLAVATHLAYCPTCRSVVESADDLGGALLDDEMPDALSPGSFEAMLKKIKTPVPPKPVVESVISPVLKAPSDTLVPQPLRNYLGGGLETIPWKPIGGGAQQHLIPTADDSQVRLLKIPACQPVPEHTHGGRELTLVLAGSFSDEAGRFGPGDLEDVDEATTHQPVAGVGEVCICLAVTDAPLKFSGLLPRLFQPFNGI